MYYFGERSTEHLLTCHPKLQLLAHAVLRHMNVSCLEGYRSPEKQLEHFEAGRSKVKIGKHNVRPSKAIHLAPYPYQESDLRPYYYMGGIAKAEAARLGIKIRWGGDWDMDGDVFDQTFNDLMHIELLD